MILFQQIDRMKYIHQLIQKKQTGSPERFATKLGLSKRQLFNILEELRIMGLDIQYSRGTETYFYANNKYMEIVYSLKELTEEEVGNTNGGAYFMRKCNFISLYAVNFAS